MSRLLKRFGHGSSTIDWGYDLPILIGHLEALKDDEEYTVGDSLKGPKAKRLAMVEDALQLLNDAMDMGDEER